ncbi:MAG: tetratricopeptide repeat protein [Actinomycetia bacterium]|nr:tetratricopeptide repeat protein [Actinomycetes bacterium]
MANIADLSLFSEAEAVAFVQSRVPGVAAVEAGQLAGLLGFIPMALEHATAFLVQSGQDCASYIGLLRQHGFDELRIRYSAEDCAHELMAASVQLLTIDAIESQSARQLLYLLAYCATDSLPLSLLQRGQAALPQPLQGLFGGSSQSELKQVLNMLVGFALISVEGDDGGAGDGGTSDGRLGTVASGGNRELLLTMPVVTQLAVKHQAIEGEDTFWLSCCLSMADTVVSGLLGDELTASSDDSVSARVQESTETLIELVCFAPHLLAIARQAEAALDDDCSQLAISRLYLAVGRGYECSGDYNLALECFQKALLICENIQGEQSLAAAAANSLVADAYLRLGNCANALEYAEAALRVLEDALGSEHPQTVAAYLAAANVRDDLGDFDEALAYYGKALVVQERSLGDNHPDTAATYRSIALIQRHLGDCDQAVELFQKALAVSHERLGVGHPDTVADLNNIALSYRQLADHAKELEYFQKALAIYETADKGRLYTAITYQNIGLAYEGLGDNVAALPWHEKAHELFKVVLGPEHPLVEESLERCRYAKNTP